MSEVIQWGVAAMALAVSVIFLLCKFKREASGKCDGCCERCGHHTCPTDCADFKVKK
jgi:hypothetical protein